MLELKNIKKDYATSSEVVHALRGVSLSFRKSEFVSILGPSGCGKTTLLNIIGGLDHYTSGNLVIAGRSTRSFRDRDWDVYRNHRVGFIFQSYNLIPHQTVLGNVELALTIAGMGKDERTERAKRALDRVGLSDQYYKKPNQLSGGQCQRVAIARALVNDPEILLADEPTGALDTATSVQIMNLIKEISEERLVIMVTHNPELAMAYSSRIIRLLDGQVVEDTNPMTKREETLEERERRKEKKKKRPKRERARMSLFTAFRLSAKNLLSKRGRTALVSFAGSIGIIGIAMVLAFSAGIKGYIASMQDDMLSGNPITIGETAYDLDAFSGMIDEAQKTEIIKNPNQVYINSLIEYIAKTNKDVQDIVVRNELTDDYISYLKEMPEEYYAAMLLGYGMNINPNLYTDITTAEGKQSLSIQRITDLYTQILSKTDYADLSFLIPMLAPSIKQAPSNVDYLLSQYELLGENSKVATGKNEIMLVVDSDDELSDLLLARYGYYTQEEFLKIIDKASGDDDAPLPDGYRESFGYDELIGKEFTYYPSNIVFSSIAENGLSPDATEMLKKMIPGQDPNAEFTYDPANPMHKMMVDQLFPTGYEYVSNENGIKGEGITLTVVGILSPKDNLKFGSISSGIYYTEELTNYILDANADKTTGFLSFLSDDANVDKLAISYNEQSVYGATYMFNFVYDHDSDPATENKHSGAGIVTYSSGGMSNMVSSMVGGGESLTYSDQRDMLVRTLGGNNHPNNITIYPVSFDDMYLVTEYLDAWNEEGAVTVGDKQIADTDRNDITYTNTLELVISLINTMIDVISYALIAFTSVSLVVSTVMIGIITYVSVVERIKEIGVIRSLGGRKKDVSRLFTAETFMIGGMSGLIGVIVTYIISIIVNIILEPLIGYGSIAALPITDALMLLGLSILLTLISGIIPASSAAKKDPVVALRTE